MNHGETGKNLNTLSGLVHLTWGIPIMAYSGQLMRGCGSKCKGNRIV